MYTYRSRLLFNQDKLSSAQAHIQFTNKFIKLKYPSFSMVLKLFLKHTLYYYYYGFIRLSLPFNYSLLICVDKLKTMSCIKYMYCTYINNIFQTFKKKKRKISLWMKLTKLWELTHEIDNIIMPNNISFKNFRDIQ